MSTSLGRRSFRKTYLQPHDRMRIVVFVFAGSAGLLTAISVLALARVREQLATVGQNYSLPADIVTLLQSSVIESVYIIVILGVLITVGLFLAGIKLSNEIYGPMVPIRKLINSLRAGDYSARGKLRAGDHFVEVMDELNGLAESLDTKPRF